MKTQIEQYKINLPAGLKSQIKEAAEREGRSMNAQIVQHLRTIYQPAGDTMEGATQ